MNETELERLVVRLLGDVSQFTEAMNSAKTATADATSAIITRLDAIEEALGDLAVDELGDVSEDMEDIGESIGESAQDAGDKLEDLGTSMNNLTTVMGAGTVIAREFHGMILKLSAAYVALRAQMAIIADFEQQEAAERRLNATLRATGKDVVGLMADYKAFSEEVQRTTTTADESVLSLVKQAESFKATGEAAKKAVRDAMAIADINETSAGAMIRITAAMAQGDIQRAMMFSRMVPQLRGVKNELEFVETYNNLVAAGMSAMAEEVQTAGGQMKQLGNDLSDLQEGIGRVVSGGLSPIVGGFRSVVKVLDDAGPAFDRTAVTVVAFTAVLLAADKASVKWLATLKTLAMNPLTWVIAAGAAITMYANSVIEADESTRKLKEAMDDLAKARQRDAQAEAKHTTEFLEQNKGRKEAIEKVIKANQDRINDLGRQEKEAQEALDKARGSGYNPVKWLSKKTLENVFGHEFGRVELERLKDVTSQMEAVRQANERMKAALEPKQILGVLGLSSRIMEEAAKANQKAIEEFRRVADEYHSSLVQEAEALRDKFMTPMERFIAERARLDEMLMNNLIGPDLYQKALDDLEKQLNKTADAQDRLNDTFADSAAYGSSEAARRLMAAFPGGGPVVGLPNRPVEIAVGAGRGAGGMQDIRPGALGRARGAGGLDEIRPGALGQGRGHPEGGQWINTGAAKGIEGKLDVLIGVIREMGIAGIRLGHVRVRG